MASRKISPLACKRAPSICADHQPRGQVVETLLIVNNSRWAPAGLNTAGGAHRPRSPLLLFAPIGVVPLPFHDVPNSKSGADWSSDGRAGRYKRPQSIGPSDSSRGRIRWASVWYRRRLSNSTTPHGNIPSPPHAIAVVLFAFKQEHPCSISRHHLCQSRAAETSATKAASVTTGTSVKQRLWYLPTCPIRSASLPWNMTASHRTNASRICRVLEDANMGFAPVASSGRPQPLATTDINFAADPSKVQGARFAKGPNFTKGSPPYRNSPRAIKKEPRQ